MSALTVALRFTDDPKFSEQDVWRVAMATLLLGQSIECGLYEPEPVEGSSAQALEDHFIHALKAVYPGLPDSARDIYKASLMNHHGQTLN